MLSGFSKILASTAASVGKTVQSTVHDVTGPKCLSEYEMGEQIGSGGPGMLWKLYKATPVSEAKKAVMPEVCVWYLDKKSLAEERSKRGTSKAAEDTLLDIFRADAKVIQKLRHPGIVRVVEPLDESKWAMAMVTEPIFSSVFNGMGNLENLSSIPPELEKLELGQLEIKHGLMQLSEALSFIHRNARLIHRGISPDSIYITTNGGWKFAGFGFSTMAEESPMADDPAFMYPDYDVDYPVLPLQPLLDYTAPELTRPLPLSARGGGLDARLSVDLFSLGLVAYHLLTKRSLLRCNNNLDTHNSKVQCFRSLPMNEIPMDLEPELRRMLNPEPMARPTASEFAASRFFTDDLRLKALQFLDQMIGRGNDQRAEFLNSLPGIWSGFDSRVLRFKVLPPLLNELKNPATQLLALPWVLEVVEVQEPKDFQVRTQQLLIPAMEAAHGELLLLFLKHMPALVAKASPELMMSHLLPMMMRAFEDADPRLQEETLRRSIAMVPKLDFALVKDAILPRIHMLALRTSVAAVRVQALASLGEMVPTLDKPAVMDILQTMARCASVDHSPPTLMCIVGVCDVVQKGYGMEFSAQHILPLLTPLLTVQQLSNAQFARMLKLIMDVLTQLQDKRGVALSEADTISLDLASMGIAPINGDAPAFPESKPSPDSWGAMASNTGPSPSKNGSDPFASMPALTPPSSSSISNSVGFGGPPSAAGSSLSGMGGIGASNPMGNTFMGNSTPLGTTPSAGPLLASTSSTQGGLGGPLMGGSSFPASPPLGGVKPGGGAMPDLFASPGGPASSGSSLTSAWGAPASKPVASAPDPFALSAGSAGGIGGGVGGMGAHSSGGGRVGGMGGTGGLSGMGGYSAPSLGGGAGMVSLVPDKPPPADDPFADWPPRKPNPPPSTSGVSQTSFGGNDWGSLTGSTPMNPGPIRAPQQPGTSFPSMSGPGMGQGMGGMGRLAPPAPPPGGGFASFPQPGASSQQSHQSFDLL